MSRTDYHTRHNKKRKNGNENFRLEMRISCGYMTFPETTTTTMMIIKSLDELGRVFLVHP